MNLPDEDEAPEQPQVPQFPTDRVEKGESSDQIRNDE